MTIDRRDLLLRAGAVVGAAAFAGRAVAQPSRAKVIDVHTHMYSHGWVKAVTDADMKGILARVDALPAGQRDALRSGNAGRLFDFG